MGRRKKIVIATDEDRAKYKEYIEPNHALVLNTVVMMTMKKTDIKDNFQDICAHLLRYIGTYSPEKRIDTWIMYVVRREVGKLEAAKDSYVRATKGSDFEYTTKHSGYKEKYRPKSAKDYVTSFDDVTFKSQPNEMIHDGVDDKMMEIIQNLLPTTNLGGGSYSDVLKAVYASEDMDIKILFMMYYDEVKVSGIADELKMTERDVKNALGRAKGRLKRAKNI
mgnify:CR=1 FL=1